MITLRISLLDSYLMSVATKKVLNSCLLMLLLSSKSKVRRNSKGSGLLCMNLDNFMSPIYMILFFISSYFLLSLDWLLDDFFIIYRLDKRVLKYERIMVG